MSARFLAILSFLATACGPGPPPPVTVELSLPPGSGEPHLFAAADGRVLLSWFEPRENGGHALLVAERVDGRWGEGRVAAEGRDFFVNWADFPSIAELQDGTWVVHWPERVAEAPYAYHVMLALSRDRGRTWSAPRVPHADLSPTEHGFVSLEPWEGGAVLVWLDGREMAGGRGGPMTLRAARLDAGGAVSPDVLVDGRTCECCNTALVRTARGLLAAYRDRSETEIRDIFVARYEGGRWSEPRAVARDGWEIAACPVNGPGLAAAGDTVALVWFTGAGDRPRVQAAFSADGGATFGPPVSVDDGLPRGRVDVALLEDGSALVVWLEVSDDRLEIRARRVLPDGSRDASWPVGTTADSRASGFPRLVRIARGALFAWTVPGEDGGVRVGRVEM